MYPILPISPEDYAYPQRLREIHLPPRLYIAGDNALLQYPAIAVVGSRAMTRYGESICRQLVRDLVDCGFIIVSGLATGIDGVAHQAAIANGGLTIAVLGSGLDPDSLYPAEHRTLAHTIANGHGVLVSEYAPGSRAQQYCFPARNRIIAGLTVGTVVIEARLKSGALITAKRALEYNREVFAVPGSVLSSRSSGVHQLLRQGAILTESYKDILAELPTMSGIRDPQSGAHTSNLSKEQQAIIKLLGEHACHPDSLSATLHISADELLFDLTELEIKGIVRKNIDYTYSLI